MNNFDKIYKYFSGEMSDIEEKNFFHELSKDDTLLEEFNKQKSIKDVLKRDKFLESSPSSSKENLFMNLGLDLPAKSTTTTFSLIKNKWLNVLSYSGISLLSGLVVYLLLNNLYESEKFKQNNKLAKINLEINSQIEKIKFLSTQNEQLNDELLKNKILYEEKLNNLKNSKNRIKYIEKIIYKDKLITVNTNDANSNELLINNENLNSKDNIIFVELENAKLSNQNYLKINSEFEELNSDYNLKFIDNINESIDLLDKFSFEYTCNYDVYEINPRTTPNRFSSFNNNSFSIFYNLTDKFDLGLNLIGESFSLKYINTEEDGDYWYYQTPNYLTGSLIGKYRFDITNELNLSPYIMSGYNRTGIVFRGGLGVKYMFNDYVGMLLNSHYSNMIFENNNLINYSGKYSFQLGVTWKK